MGRESCETVTTVFVSLPPPYTGGNEARNIFGRKLDIGDGGERPRGAESGAPLARGEVPRLYGVTRPRCLALAWASLYIGAPTRISRDLARFRIPQ
jgi:hypothetical protein